MPSRYCCNHNGEKGSIIQKLLTIAYSANLNKLKSSIKRIKFISSIKNIKNITFFSDDIEII